MLLGNTLRWDIDYLARQLPVLPARDGFPRKVKPLVRLTERETAAWCIVRGIDYLVEECPMAAGNKHLGYKAALNALEARVAGHEGGVLPRLRRADGAAARPATAATAATSSAVLPRCGAPTTRRGVRVLPARRARRRRTSRCRSSWSPRRARVRRR